MKRSAELQDRFEALLTNHRAIIFKVARSYCWNQEDQIDLAQEIRFQLWRAFSKYDDRRSFSTWMYRIALNVAISQARQSDTQKLVSLEEVGFEVPDKATNHMQDDLMDQVHLFLEGVDVFSRALLLLHLDDKTNREISEILGITETNVATKISRLKQRIRSHEPIPQEK